MMKRALCVGALIFAPVDAQAAMPVSPLPDIYQSYNDCLAVAGSSGLSQSKLAELGWVKGSVTGSDGKPVANAPLIFGRGDRKPLLMLSAPSGAGLCIVTARIATRATFVEFLKAWHGELPPADEKGAISFSDDGHLVQIRQTGTTEEPALSMAVMTPEKK